MKERRKEKEGRKRKKGKKEKKEKEREKGKKRQMIVSGYTSSFISVSIRERMGKATDGFRYPLKDRDLQAGLERGQLDDHTGKQKLGESFGKMDCLLFRQLTEIQEDEVFKTEPIFDVVY